MQLSILSNFLLSVPADNEATFSVSSISLHPFTFSFKLFGLSKTAFPIPQNTEQAIVNVHKGYRQKSYFVLYL